MTLSINRRKIIVKYLYIWTKIFFTPKIFYISKDFCNFYIKELYLCNIHCTEASQHPDAFTGFLILLLTLPIASSKSN